MKQFFRFRNPDPTPSSSISASSSSSTQISRHLNQSHHHHNTKNHHLHQQHQYTINVADIGPPTFVTQSSFFPNSAEVVFGPAPTTTTAADAADAAVAVVAAAAASARVLLKSTSASRSSGTTTTAIAAAAAAAASSADYATSVLAAAAVPTCTATSPAARVHVQGPLAPVGSTGIIIMQGMARGGLMHKQQKHQYQHDDEHDEHDEEEDEDQDFQYKMDLIFIENEQEYSSSSSPPSKFEDVDKEDLSGVHTKQSATNTNTVSQSLLLTAKPNSATKERSSGPGASHTLMTNTSMIIDSNNQEQEHHQQKQQQQQQQQQHTLLPTPGSTPIQFNTTPSLASPQQKKRYRTARAIGLGISAPPPNFNCDEGGEYQVFSPQKGSLSPCKLVHNRPAISTATVIATETTTTAANRNQLQLKIQMKDRLILHPQEAQQHADIESSRGQIADSKENKLDAGTHNTAAAAAAQMSSCTPSKQLSMILPLSMSLPQLSASNAYDTLEQSSLVSSSNYPKGILSQGAQGFQGYSPTATKTTTILRFSSPLASPVKSPVRQLRHYNYSGTLATRTSRASQSASSNTNSNNSSTLIVHDGAGSTASPCLLTESDSETAFVEMTQPSLPLPPLHMPSPGFINNPSSSHFSSNSSSFSSSSSSLLSQSTSSPPLPLSKDPSSTSTQDPRPKLLKTQSYIDIKCAAPVTSAHLSPVAEDHNKSYMINNTHRMSANPAPRKSTVAAVTSSPVEYSFFSKQRYLRMSQSNPHLTTLDIPSYTRKSSSTSNISNTSRTIQWTSGHKTNSSSASDPETPKTALFTALARKVKRHSINLGLISKPLVSPTVSSPQPIPWPTSLSAPELPNKGQSTSVVVVELETPGNALSPQSSEGTVCTNNSLSTSNSNSDSSVKTADTNLTLVQEIETVEACHEKENINPAGKRSIAMVQNSFAEKPALKVSTAEKRVNPTNDIGLEAILGEDVEGFWWSERGVLGHCVGVVYI